MALQTWVDDASIVLVAEDGVAEVERPSASGRRARNMPFGGVRTRMDTLSSARIMPLLGRLLTTEAGAHPCVRDVAAGVLLSQGRDDEEEAFETEEEDDDA